MLLKKIQKLVGGGSRGKGGTTARVVAAMKIVKLALHFMANLKRYVLWVNGWVEGGAETMETWKGLFHKADSCIARG